MSYCAYEIKIPNLEELKQEWREYWPDQPQTFQGSIYVNHKTVGPETIKLYEFFDNCFLDNMRFVKVGPGINYTMHMDIDVDKKDYFDGEIPFSSIRKATINILLGEPDVNKTQWWVDLKATKQDWDNHYNYKDKEWKLIDECQLTETPMLINTGQWHSIKYTKERWMVGLHFHPLTSFIGAIEYCKHKGLLIERESNV
tara:strand:- start:733 stop:1329 length:597 start_codon:yes stop_codon:yes gene_type:complete